MEEKAKRQAINCKAGGIDSKGRGSFKKEGESTKKKAKVHNHDSRT